MAGEPKLNPDEADVDNAGVVIEETPPNKIPDDAGFFPKILVEGDGAAVLVDSEEPRALGGAKGLTLGVEPKIEVEGGLKSDAGVKDGCFEPKPPNSGDGLVIGPEVEWLSFAEESYSFCTFDL